MERAPGMDCPSFPILRNPERSYVRAKPRDCETARGWELQGVTQHATRNAKRGPQYSNLRHRSTLRLRLCRLIALPALFLLSSWKFEQAFRPMIIGAWGTIDGHRF